MPAAGSMDDIRARVATPREIRDWDDIVSHFPQRRVMHRRSWLRSLERSGHGAPLHLIVERQGAVVGCLPGLLTRVGPLHVFGSPPPGSQTASMGPLFDPACVAAADLVCALVRELEDLPISCST